MVPEFEQCVFGTDVGTTATCTTQFGHHLVLVEEEREAPPEVKSMGPLELKELLEVADTVIDDDEVHIVAAVQMFQQHSQQIPVT